MWIALRRTLAVRLALIPILIWLTGCSSDRQQNNGVAVTLSSCLRSLTNLDEFAESPFGSPALLSSHDRTGGNEDWAKFPQPGKDNLITIAELKGPGCVRRIWMTTIQEIADEWLIFFDGEKEPRYRLGKTGLFGKAEPFLPPLCDAVSSGFYCYMPMPYAKSLKIVIVVPKLTPQMRPYFQINYETYPKGTTVETLPAKLSDSEAALLKDVRDIWSHTADAAEQARQACKPPENIMVQPGQTATWLKNESGGTLKTFWINAVPAAEVSALEKSRMLRYLVLNFYWDGSNRPGVTVPLGDFFCNANSRRKFSSLPVTVLENAMVCRFPMPFHKSVLAEIRNDGAFPVSITSGCDIQPTTPTNRINYFHAVWNQSVSQGFPHYVLRAAGKGHLAGCYLANIGMDGSWSIFEGDDMIWINGEDKQSFNGTGLEDYFNGGWYYSGLFELPLHGLVEKAPIRSSQYRFHLPERIAFTNGMTFSFEFGEASMAKGYMSSVGYWYGDDPASGGNEIKPNTPRFPPPDPLEPTAVICRLAELERIGRYDEASVVCQEYADKFATAPWTGAMRLRALAYREEVEGFSAVSNAYQQIKEQANNPQLAKQAEDLLWFHLADTNALLGINGFCKFRAYLDGKFLGEADDPTTLFVYPVTLTPGEHEIELELTSTRPDGFFLAYLRCHNTNVASDASWKYERQKPAGWPEGPMANATWKPVEAANHVLPKMIYWQFVPNAYIKMQSGKNGIRPWLEWGTTKDKVPAYVRRKFVIPQESQ